VSSDGALCASVDGVIILVKITSPGRSRRPQACGLDDGGDRHFRGAGAEPTRQPGDRRFTALMPPEGRPG